MKKYVPHRTMSGCGVVFFLLAIFNLPVQAQISMSGYGIETCGKVTLAYTKSSNPVGGMRMDEKIYLEETNGFTQWMSGFVSSYNWHVAKEKTQLPLDPVAMGYWLKKYCENNPTQLVAHAANNYIQEHRKK